MEDQDQTQPNSEHLTKTIPTATATTPPMPQTERRTVLLGLFGVLALFLLSWLSWPAQAPEVRVMTPSRLQESPLFATSATTQAALDEVTLQFTSKPPGAHVVGFISGEPFQAEPTPSQLQVPRGASVEITFVAPGYKPELKVITVEKEQEVSAALLEQKKSSGRFGGFR